jgi:hypothetical protein
MSMAAIGRYVGRAQHEYDIASIRGGLRVRDPLQANEIIGRKRRIAISGRRERGAQYKEPQTNQVPVRRLAE